MKYIAFVLVLSLFAGCGSSGDPVFDGFTPSGGAAVIFDPAVCDIAFVGSSAVAGIALDFTDFGDSCDVIEETSLCGNKASSTRVLAFVLGGEVGADSTEPLGPGKYAFMTEPPSGTFKTVTAQAVQADAECEPLSDDTNLDMSGGSVQITDVTQNTVSGSTSINFENGKVFEYTFELPICDVTLGLCSRFLALHGFPGGCGFQAADLALRLV